MLLRQIEYFQAVVECGSFYAAAEKCNVSQSAISQQIKKLEDELNVQLLTRHNRTFSLTPAGTHFYKKTLVLVSDMERMIRETKQISNGDSAVLRLGHYRGYHGSEFSEAVMDFSEKYPGVKLEIMTGSHEDIYYALQDGKIDIGLNDLRRAFSDAYNNLVLARSNTYIEISSRNPLCRLESLDVQDLRNIPCILYINSAAQEEEQRYYDEIMGLHGDFLFSETLQDARLKIITGKGYMPVDVIGESEWFDTAVSRIPLMRNGEPVQKIYGAFWQKTNSGFYVEEFADMLLARFRN